MKIFYFLYILLFLLCAAAFAQQQSPSELLEHNPQTLYTDKGTTQTLDEDTHFFEQGRLDFKVENEDIDEYKLLPPLSIEDSLELLNKCSDLIAIMQKEKDRTKKDFDLVIKIIDNVANYTQIIDDRNETLAYYVWTFVGTKKVSKPSDIDIYPITPPIKHINAISFTALRNLVYINKIKITNSDNISSEFKIDKWISDQLPGKQVCFLPTRQNISKIEIEYSTKPDAESTPRVSLYVGITKYPEFAKRAIYYLRLAKQNINEGNYASALDKIYRAQSSLIKYKDTRNL